MAVEFVTPETVLIDRSNADLIVREIDELPVHFREVLLLCEVALYFRAAEDSSG